MRPLDGKRHRVTGFAATGFARRRNQLAQYLSYGLRTNVAQLIHGSSQGPAQRRRHREAGQSPLQGLDPAPVGPLLKRRVQ
jgi:hypothetical protein